MLAKSALLSFEEAGFKEIFEADDSENFRSNKDDALTRGST